MARQKLQVRISGLVRLARRVRHQLIEGIPKRRLGQFRAIIRGAIDKVESVCRAVDGTPDGLPAPSRNAYRFLREIDLEHLPVSEAGEQARPAIGIKNVVANQKLLHRRVNELAGQCKTGQLTEATHAEAIPELLPLVSGWAQQIEEILSRKGASLSSLGRPTQRAYALFRFLSDPTRMAEHLDTVSRFLLLSRRREGTSLQTEIGIELGCIGNLYSYRGSQAKRRYCVSENFLGAEDEVLEAVLECIHRRKPGPARRIVNEYQETDAFCGIAADLEALLGRGEGDGRGRVYDLEEIFDAVNRGHFSGEMSRPRLRWSSRLTFRKFGHYCFSTDEVMLSATLDSPNVERFVLEYVMYHELLHKKHGEDTSGARRVYHSREFRAEERRFPRYKEADEGLGKLSSARRKALF